jgi:Keratinocyte-associated gene product
VNIKCLMFKKQNFLILAFKATGKTEEINSDVKNNKDLAQAAKSNDLSVQNTTDSVLKLDNQEQRVLLPTTNKKMLSAEEKTEKFQANLVTNKTELTSLSKTDGFDIDEMENSMVDQKIFEETQSDISINKDEEEGIENIDESEDDYAQNDDFPARGNNKINDHNKHSRDPINDIEMENDLRVNVQRFEEDPDSNFFTYLCITMFLSILAYVLYHNRQKILALLVEGRRGSRRSRERSKGSSNAGYSKLALDCNLEEAITSKNSPGKGIDIIY